MNKEDWIWVAIKIFGIYLIILAITSIPELITNWWTVSPFSSVKSKVILSSGDDCQLLADRMRMASISNLVASIAKVSLFSVVGIYLVKSGKILFAIMFQKHNKCTSD